jgi:hypothetical protein
VSEMNENKDAPATCGCSNLLCVAGEWHKSGPTAKARDVITNTDVVFAIARTHRTCDEDHCHCWDEIRAALSAERKAGYEAATSDRPSCHICEAEGYRRGVEGAAGIVEGWHIKKGGYGILAERIRGLDK